MDVADAELRRLLPASGAVPADWLAAWEQVPTAAPVSSELVLGTAELLSSGLRAACAPLASKLALGAPAQSFLEPGAVSQAGGCLRALDVLLARAGAEMAAASAVQVLAQLEASTEVLAAHATAKLLLPPRGQGEAEAEAALLRLPLLILARCVGVQRLTVRELLGVARGDVATAVAIAVAAVREPGSPPLPKLRERLWLILHDLSTPQHAATQVGQGEENDTPMEVLLAQHLGHAHRLALCMVQFDALEAACDGAQDPQERAAVLVACLRTVHNLTASPNLWASGRLLARQLAVLWPRFGFRLLAPHLRRLLTTAKGTTGAARQAARELRRDLRTFGWVLHHSPELRPYARPLCVEVAMKAASTGHPPETLAVALGAAANSGALAERGPLYAMLERVAPAQKDAVCNSFPSEANRLWVIEEAWDVVEELGFWPRRQEAEVAAAACAGGGAAAQQLADVAAIVRLQPWANIEGAQFTFAFNFVDPDWQDFQPYEPWDEDEDDGWEDWEGDEAEEDEDWWSPQYAEASGPLGLLSVEPPTLPPSTAPGAALPMQHLCLAPEAFRCAVDGRLCTDPVRTSGGILYARRSISAWLSWNKVCPVTGADLASADLVTDAAVSQQIGAWLCPAS